MIEQKIVEKVIEKTIENSAKNIMPRDIPKEWPKPGDIPKRPNDEIPREWPEQDGIINRQNTDDIPREWPKPDNLPDDVILDLPEKPKPGDPGVMDEGRPMNVIQQSPEGSKPPETNDKPHENDNTDNGENQSDETDTEDDINPEDYLDDQQIEKINKLCEKLGLTKEETEAKIKEYAQKAKACKEAEEKGVDNLSDKEKGNYGEMKADLDMLDKGYLRISVDGVTKLNDTTKQGIDGVYQNPDGKPPYVILDAKYGESQLNTTKDGKQLSDTWIDNRLDNAVGKEKADEIRDAMIEGDVGVAVARVDADGNVTHEPVDSNGEHIDTEDVNND